MVKVSPKHKYLKELGMSGDKPYYFDGLDEEPEEYIKKDKHYMKTGIHYAEIWNFDRYCLAWLYEHLRYYKDYTVTQLYPSYDKETGKKNNPNMIKYQGKEYYMGSLIDILCDKIRYYFKHNPEDFIKYKTGYISGHQGEPKNSLLLTEGELKHWQSKGLFKEDKDGLTRLDNPHTFNMSRIDQVGLFKYKQYTSDIWKIWAALQLYMWD